MATEPGSVAMPHRPYENVATARARSFRYGAPLWGSRRGRHAVWRSAAHGAGYVGRSAVVMPEGQTILAPRFIAGLFAPKDAKVPEGRSKMRAIRSSLRDLIPGAVVVPVMNHGAIFDDAFGVKGVARGYSSRKALIMNVCSLAHWRPPNGRRQTRRTPDGSLQGFI